MDFLHPVLMNTSVSIFELLCDGFLKYRYSDSDFADSIHLGLSVFLVFASRYPNAKDQLLGIAERILEWLPKIHERKLAFKIFCIDALNYILGQMDKIGQQETITEFNPVMPPHDKLILALNGVPPEVRKYLILCDPPVCLKPVAKPLFLRSSTVGPAYAGGTGHNDDEPLEEGYGDENDYWDW
jgi:hypothetical protein